MFICTFNFEFCFFLYYTVNVIVIIIPSLDIYTANGVYILFAFHSIIIEFIIIIIIIYYYLYYYLLLFIII